MSDTLRRMLVALVVRVARVAAVAVLASACSGDLDLDVRVRHPDGVPVARTEVTVYESPTLTCIDVAFSRLGPDELAAVEIAQQSVTTRGDRTGSLTGISRTDHKVIVARGFAADDSWITAGCEEQDVVEESTKINITTMETVSTALVLDSDQADPLLAIIATTDAMGRAVSDRRVAWRVYGPAGSQPMSTNNVESPSDGIWQPTRATCTKASGAAGVHPPPPDVIGGYAVQLAAEWGTTQPPRYSRLVASFGARMLNPPTGSPRFCAIRRAGAARRLVCLDGLTAVDFEVTASGGTPTLVQRNSTNIGPDSMNLVAVAGSGNDVDVYGVTSRGQLVPLFGAAPVDNSAAPCFDGSCVIEDVLSVPACGNQPAKLLMKVRGSGASQVKQLGVHGGNASDFPLGTLVMNGQVQLDNAGCVTRADLGGAAPTIRQVITYHIGTRNLLNELVPVATRAAYNCGPNVCLTNELLPGAGVGFSTDQESRMIAASVDATGVVLTELVMAPQPEMPARDVFVERKRIPSAATPDHIIPGQFDGDGERDLFWTVGTRRGTSFEVAYARTIGGQPLAALSASQPLVISSLLVDDLTGDGLDDAAAVGSVDGVTYGVVVIPAGTKAPTITVPPDATCQ